MFKSIQGAENRGSPHSIFSSLKHVPNTGIYGDLYSILFSHSLASQFLNCFLQRDTVSETRQKVLPSYRNISRKSYNYGAVLGNEITVTFSPAIPRQVHSLVGSHTIMSLPAFNMEPNAASFHPSFLQPSPMETLGNRQGGDHMLRVLVRPRHRLDTILLPREKEF